MKRQDIFGLVALVVCLGGVFALAVLAPEKAEPQVYAPLEVPGSALGVLLEQQAGADEIIVAATLAEPGFVTIHHAVGEAPADVLGVSDLLPAGQYPELAVPLATKTQEATTYFLLLFVDNGNGVYEPGVDLPVKVDGMVLKEKLEL